MLVLLATKKLSSPFVPPSSAAENEFSQLRDYYVRTDEFRRAIRGEARIAVGRKGTGKSALFFQARDAVRQNRRNIVLDLKPEGHQFKRLRDTVLAQIDETSHEHLATAFWEYLLTTELAGKTLRSERQSHLQHSELLEPYQVLATAFGTGATGDGTGDFSERILALVQRLADDFPASRTGDGGVLSPGAVAQLVYRHDLPELQAALEAYCDTKMKRGASSTASTRAGLRAVSRTRTFCSCEGCSTPPGSSSAT